MSWRTFFEELKQRAFSRRASFKTRWQAFCLAEFSSPEELAAAFGVSIRTAELWRNGIVGGSGFAVDIAYQDYPEQANTHLRIAA